ncbi:tRNA pseudouridine(38-40) synthase TruA [Lachnoclostridium sp. An131]|uniref:tRNA pseudouridine(38-40) synthase TruA n=1 Tax=Lachnoclostridium sp. An131 TaxID=1965555 RepID=UPI000B3AAE62|nr:tRNA pseudouridine(38-40) synthase TruA [Lachnoclostridium sp. An131]OUQ22907.1 tRNA pseudouridine(38-40) synthase TruA [Lachnoclostridium sp. An131]
MSENAVVNETAAAEKGAAVNGKAAAEHSEEKNAAAGGEALRRQKRVLLSVAYDGTSYCGWQVQKNGETIEGVLNRELSRLFGEEITVIGASRTDSGVHALGNVAVFDTEARMPADKMAYALNSRLPDDIRIQRSFEVPSDFHPRKTACVKTYEYRILNREFELPSERLNSYFFRRCLDVERMKAACPYFTGEHDFKSFCSIHTQAETTVRTIYSLEVTEQELDSQGRLICIRVTGNGFLYNMVRILAGTLIQIGLTASAPEDVAAMLEARDRQAAGPTAPAKGLTLLGMRYPEYPEFPL